MGFVKKLEGFTAYGNSDGMATVRDCLIHVLRLNNTSLILFKKGDLNIKNKISKQWMSRVVSNNITYASCQILSECLGVDKTTFNNWINHKR